MGVTARTKFKAGRVRERGAPSASDIRAKTQSAAMRGGLTILPGASGDGRPKAITEESHAMFRGGEVAGLREDSPFQAIRGPPPPLGATLEPSSDGRTM